MADAKRILVVDDHFRILDSIKSLLETSAKEYEVIGVPSAEEGILELRGEPVDLLITDVYLPGMSGGELIVRVNKLWPELPIIVITGHADKMGKEEAAKSGIVHYFKKPLEPDVFLEAVHSVMEPSDREDDGLSDEADQETDTSKMRTVTSVMEGLRSDTGAREVLLASNDGEVLYVTGGRESAFSNLTATFAKTISGIFQLAERMGSPNPFTYHYISDRTFELYFASAGLDHYVAVLYYAQSRDQTIESVWTYTKIALDNILQVLHDDRQIELPVAAVETRESEKEHDSGEDHSPLEVETDQVEHVSDEAPVTSSVPDSQLPDIDETVDLDAFWDEALAVELGDEESGEGFNIDEARRIGLIPPEFDPGSRSSS